MLRSDLSSKSVLITGAGGAIGGVMAKIFAENGASVAVCDINIEAASKVADEINAAGYESGGKAAAFRLDVTNPDSAAQVGEAVYNMFGGLHVVINNAGVNVGPDDRRPIHEFSAEKWDWITGIDLDGVFKCSQALVPFMIKSGGGSMINISSVVGQVPFRNQCAFAAAKAGVVNLSKAMALELAPENIRVNVICPGSILMEGTKALFYADKERAEAMMSHIPQHRPGKPEDVSYAALFLASDESSYMTGSVMTVDGGWTCGFARDF